MPKKLKTHAASVKFKVVQGSFTGNNVAETARKYSLNAKVNATSTGGYSGPDTFFFTIWRGLIERFVIR